VFVWIWIWIWIYKYEYEYEHTYDDDMIMIDITDEYTANNFLMKHDPINGSDNHYYGVHVLFNNCCFK